MNRRSDTTTKVFVGSLPPNVTAQDLRDLFNPYGAIAECDIANRCGFLHLEDKDLANKAIEELNNTTFMGGRISVEKGRVKPPRSDRRGGGSGGGGGGGGPMRSSRGGPGGARKPYSREGSFGRGGPRNGGGFGRGDYGDFDSDYPPRDFGGGYDDGFDRRPRMFEERRGGGGGEGYGDRRPFNNGYERRMYGDSMSQYPESQRGGYGDRRMPSSGSFEDRRPPMGERRPLIPEGGLSGASRPPMSNYDRAPSSGDSMFSRRDMPPKTGGGGGYDRQASTGTYTSFGSASGGSYNQPQAGGYGDNRGSTSALSSGYGMERQAPTSGGYSTGGQGAAYGSTLSGSASGGYGDNYGSKPTNTYDSAYPPLPQQGGFAGGNAPSLRDMPPARRY